jgi:hypothetical protein
MESHASTGRDAAVAPFPANQTTNKKTTNEPERGHTYQLHILGGSPFWQEERMPKSLNPFPKEIPLVLFGRRNGCQNH